MRQIYFILVLFFASQGASNLYAQCSAPSMSQQEKASLADALFSGKVVSKECRYDAAGNIITINKTEVLENKGTRTLPQYIEVITPGGVMQDNAQFYFPSLSLQVGEQGMFYCSEKSGNYFPVGLTQGFEPAEEMTEKSDIAHIYSISPSVITAGTQDVITITGDNFGAVQGDGTVSFRNADNGGAGWVTIPPGPHYILWSNTEIRLFVPTYTANGVAVAGTGTVKVNTPAGDHIVSPEPVEVSYALNELVYNNRIGAITLADVNNGGYVLQMSSLLAQNTNAKNGFLKALNTWRCNTSVNIFADTTSSFSGTASYNDGINTVSFDEAGLLPLGALALTVVSVSACSNEGVVNWQVREMDIVFNSVALWWMSANQILPGYFDFESVALHELGHAHLLQHNNNQGSAMYFHLHDGEMKRNVLSESSLAGGVAVMQNSVNPGYNCGSYGHIIAVGPDACSTVGIEDATGADEAVVRIFPNPSNGNFSIMLDNPKSEQYDLRIYNSIGQVVMTKIINGKNTEAVSLPASQGMYILELSSGKKVIREKIIIE